MPGPADPPPTVTPAYQGRNLFLEADPAHAQSSRGDAHRDGEATSPSAAQAGSPIHADAQDLSRRGSLIVRRRRRGDPSSTAVARWAAAALAVAAVTAAVLTVALAPSERDPMRADHSGRRPATAAPVVNEPRDIPRRAGDDEAPKPRHTARARPRPTRAAARGGVRQPAPAREPPSPPSPPADPAPSRSLTPSPSLTPAAALGPTPSAAPAPSRVTPRAPALPAPVPSDTPPEFM